MIVPSLSLLAKCAAPHQQHLMCQIPPNQFCVSPALTVCVFFVPFHTPFLFLTYPSITVTSFYLRTCCLEFMKSVL